MTVAAYRPVVDAVIATLEGTSGVPEVGDGDMPTLTGQTYVIVTPFGGTRGGSLGATNEDGWPEVLCRSWGQSRAQAGTTRDRVASALLTDGAVTVDGQRVHVSSVVSRETHRDDTTAGPARYVAVDVFRVYTTPTSE